MILTEEQQEIVRYIKTVDRDHDLILIDSVAGSGKTTLLTAIAATMSPQSKGLYLAYNKAIATSSQKKFPKNFDCRTTHSLAYAGTVKPMNLSIGYFGPRQITESIPYNDKYYLTEDIREFCLSKYLTYDEYAKENNRINIKLANKYLDLMSSGTIECTHDFYLKMFHMMLAEGNINQVDYDIIMLDEAGDLNEVTLEIFRLLSSKTKVAVGDPFQNIYTFNHTINCFEVLKPEGITFQLSQSFRVPQHIASPVELFCKTYMNPDMVFKGVDSDKTEVKTRGYISRTNGGLISKMIKLNNENTPYGLVRKAQEIFKVPLMVAGLKYQGRIYDPAYKHLQDDVDDWYENKNNVKLTHRTLNSYIKHRYEEDLGIIQALSLISKHGKSELFEAYAEAKKHEAKKHDFLLLTAHSSKGLEFDEVILAPDMHNYLEKLMESFKENPNKTLTSSEKEALNLYYVAATRALVRLQGATYLKG